MSTVKLSVYCKGPSKLKEILAKIDFKMHGYNFNFFTNTDFPGDTQIIVLETKKSFDKIKETVNHLHNKYHKSLFIIVSNIKDTRNTVNWIKSGVFNYLVIDEITPKSFLCDLHDCKNAVEKIDPISERLILCTKPDWSELKDNYHYDLSLTMYTLVFPPDSLGRYSKENREKIYELFYNKLDGISKNYGGLLWFRSNDTFVVAFRFGDYINSSVLMASYILNRFPIICLEKLRLDEILKIKISTHTGHSIFYRKDTDQITSDLINSLAHLQYQYTNDNNYYISENVFEKLITRQSKYFIKQGSFENKDIYKYIGY